MTKTSGKKTQKPIKKASVPKLKKDDTGQKTLKAGAFKASLLRKPLRRRGRRPKNAEGYQPMHNNQEDVQPENEHLEYDTGIKASDVQEDGLFNLDRFEDYDEELNFDY